MRRRLREASVGLSIIVAAIAASGLWLWLRGSIRTGNDWEVTVRFQDVGGLVPRSNVVYRGVDVGDVQAVVPGSLDVKVQARLSDPDLVIVQPVIARVESGSLLGGTPKLVLKGSSNPFPAAVSPTDAACNPQRQLCNDVVITGQVSAQLDDAIAGAADLLDQAKALDLLASLDEATASTADLLDQAKELELVASVDTMANAIADTSADLGMAIADAQMLIDSLRNSLERLQPSIASINATTAHLANFAIALDDPEAIKQLMLTFDNLQRLTSEIDVISSDIGTLTGDTDFLRSARDVVVGLGLFFDDIYGRQRLLRPYDNADVAEDAAP